MEYFGYAADVGGTTVKLGFFSSERLLLEKWEIPTDTQDGGARILSGVAASLNAHRAAHPLPDGALLGAGAGVPGPVRGGRFVDGCVNLGWSGVKDAGGELSALLSLPAVCANDANIAALGEQWAGGGRGFSDMVLATLGTGVGGGIVSGGRLVTGAHGSGGEIGHIQVEPGETEPCSCGLRGCLEQYASARGMVRLAEKYLAAHPGPSGLRALPHPTAKDIWDLAKAGDAAALAVSERFCGYLGRGLAAVAAVADPQVFVLGGGVSRAGEPLLRGTEKAFRRFAFHACAGAEFRLAALGNDAGIYGCMKLLLDSVRTDGQAAAPRYGQ